MVSDSCALVFDSCWRLVSDANVFSFRFGLFSL